VLKFREIDRRGLFITKAAERRQRKITEDGDAIYPRAVASESRRSQTEKDVVKIRRNTLGEKILGGVSKNAAAAMWTDLGRSKVYTEGGADRFAEKKNLKIRRGGRISDRVLLKGVTNEVKEESLKEM